MKSRPELGEHIASQTDALMDGVRSQEAWGSLEARLYGIEDRRKPRMFRSALVWSTAAAVTACVAMTAWSLTRPLGVSVAGQSVRVGDEWRSTTGADSVSFDFTDGSRVVMGPQSRGRILDLSRTGADVLLEQGHADVSVTPRRRSTWTFVMGPFSVRVTGTKFSLDWDPASQELSVDLREGHVVAAGCTLGEGRDVFVGETLRTSCTDNTMLIAKDGPKTGLALGAAPTAEPDPIAEPVDPFVDPAPSTRQKPVIHAVPRAAAIDLMAIGDAARLAGKSTKATTAYRSFRERFPRDADAPIAAFSLGRVAFEQDADYATAAKWFRVYLRESPRGTLAREALGRLMESLYRGGNVEDARSVAADYRSRYPTGPYNQLAGSILAK